jgi:pSer/pThr/pTyr-binding forkhead associated (FHA) protein
MTDHPTPSADRLAVVHLLDSTQGHSLQTWRFMGRSLITIGRSDENDVALADPHVSRIHVKLVHEEGTWTLISTGRHGTLVDDRLVSEFTMSHNTVFRLGAAGPTLRFDTKVTETRRSETMDNINFDVLEMLEIDERRKQHEVDQIAGNALFQQLQGESRRRKRSDDSSQDQSPVAGEETI